MDSAGELVLVVEDERPMARILAASLQARGYRVAVAGTGQDGLDQSAALDPAVVLLDLGLPDIDGLEVARRMRQWSRAPIIVVTANGAEDRKVLALDEGADDYITKPFSMPELLARLRVAVRHRRALEPFVDDAPMEVGDLIVDPADHRVTVDGRAVELTPKEFDFLALLARHKGKVLTHRHILEKVWGPEAASRTEYLRTYANQLRRKLQDDPASPRLVTEPGVGYRLIARE
ncbi:MAG TPA: response regulator transcription factor [Acidimicrobiales bacterium]|jgi:two-component system KDP operon response regulator KdpE|nr:response regulator transcription factor [Acidimicrobiales bacterium]